jgi:plastocyanin
MKYAYSALPLAALTVAQQTIQVQIGPGLSYTPDTVTAAEGDIVQFTFGSGHDVVSGSFDSPCEADGMVSSGLGSDGQVFSVTVNSTDPIWMFCSVRGHCQGGMAMVINPP